MSGRTLQSHSLVEPLTQLSGLKAGHKKGIYASPSPGLTAGISLEKRPWVAEFR